MAKAGTQANQDAAKGYTGTQGDALSNFNNAMGGYTSNVNSTIAQGNPYESRSYLQNQNLLTSGAANSATTAGNQATRDVALRTGTNTAAVQASRDANTQAKQRMLTQYNAGRDTENLDKWVNQRQQLYQDQLAGANADAGIYNTASGGLNNAGSNLASIQNSQAALWEAGIGAVGAGLSGGAGTKLAQKF